MTEYNKFSNDDKMSVLFNGLTNITDKVDQCIDIQNNVNLKGQQLDAHTCRLTLLEYKSVDLKTRCRRNNLVVSPKTRMRTVFVQLTFSEGSHEH